MERAREASERWKVFGIGFGRYNGGVLHRLIMLARCVLLYDDLKSTMGIFPWYFPTIFVRKSLITPSVPSNGCNDRALRCLQLNGFTEKRPIAESIIMRSLPWSYIVVVERQDGVNAVSACVPCFSNMDRYVFCRVVYTPRSSVGHSYFAPSCQETNTSSFRTPLNVRLVRLGNAK
ncbi:hypothetical protein ARMSODRAFT_602672 [Armillaria solidipes]|uniref:Uncharacterized protein n=1 Tax=Armillaria solidipes TaxID=1076256 RepID=A0A2H3B908_9AGAR|nr:hypothetical protein ARMSODRAFT_602672 [Armillaria solidipes]